MANCAPEAACLPALRPRFPTQRVARVRQDDAQVVSRFRGRLHVNLPIEPGEMILNRFDALRPVRRAIALVIKPIAGAAQRIALARS